jgi:ubiquinone/menaquinone biosynthesis C-methylase UbiE
VGDNTLDIGCGCGTMLFPIKNVIGLSGTYYGLDIDKSAISWARRRTKEASFRLLNTADTYLPVATSSIDVVLAKSLFTHLDMFTAAWYLKEVHRVLRNGGYFLTTFFIMTPQRTIHQKGKLLFWPGPPMYPYCLRLTKPDLGVAYDEGWIMDIIHQAGLVVDRLEYGTWADGKGLSFQDIIVLRRMN